MSSRQNSWLGFATMVIAAAVFAVGVHRAYQEPIASEEPRLAYAAEAYANRGTYDFEWDMTQASASSPDPQTPRRFHVHPPTYVWLVSHVGRWVGDYALGGRLLALGCVLATALLLAVLAGAIFRRAANRFFWATLTTAMYLTNPVTIKSTVVLDSDATIFTVALMLFLIVAANALRDVSYDGVVGAGVLWVLCLLCKMTSALLVLPAMVLWMLWRGWGTPRAWRGMWFVVLGLGFFVFELILGWMDFPFGSVVDYAAQRFSRYAAGSFSLARVGADIAYSVAWIGPMLMLLSCVAIGEAIRGERDPRDARAMGFVLAIALVYVLGHMVMGGTYNRFPRFQTPGIPALCLLAAWGARGVAGLELPRLETWLWTMVLGVLWYALAVGDYLHSVLYMPRAVLRGMVAEGTGEAMWAFFLQAVAYGLPFLLLVSWALWRRVVGGLVLVGALLIASNAGLTVAQARAPYGTLYDYGHEQTWEAIEQTAGLPEGWTVLAPEPFIYYRADDISEYAMPYVWDSDEALLKVLEDEYSQALVFTPLDFSVERAAELLSPRWSARFEQYGYKLRRVGSYYLWWR